MEKILRYLSLEQIRTIVLTCRTLSRIAQEYYHCKMSELYSSVELFCTKYHTPTFLELTHNPSIAKYVKRIQYFPNDEDEWSEEAIDSHLECIAKNCTNIEELLIGGCAKSISISTLWTMVRNNDSISSLGIDGFNGTVFDIMEILQGSKIAKLVMGDTKESQMTGDPKKVEQLKELDIRGWRWGVPEMRSCLQAFVNLETLRLHQCIKSEAVECISLCRHLRCLSIPFQNTKDLVPLISHLPNLQTIHCRMNQDLWDRLRTSNVKHIDLYLIDRKMTFSLFPTLESIELTWDFYQSKFKDLKSIFQATPKLKKLIAKHGILTDEHATIIVQHCPELEVINVQSQSITNNFLYHIGQLRSVKVLVLDQCRNMNSKGFVSLYSSPSLEELHIRNVPVTIQDTKELLDHIRTIKEVHTTISITELNRQLPNYATVFRN
jgi:hypothetical protein